MTPFYPTNFARDNYFALKSLEKPPPEKIIKAALIRWASEDVRKLLKIKACKEVLTTLHQRGSVGDNTWAKVTTQEKQLEFDINAIAAEANAIKPGWANTLFQTATEVTQNEGLRRRLADSQAMKVEFQEKLDIIQKKSLEEFSK